MFDFEWDDRKDMRNQEKHGVSFAEASTTFYDPLGIEILDPEHSDREERWIRIGMSLENELLVTVFVEREERIRIISSRLPTRREKNAYEKGV